MFTSNHFIWMGICLGCILLLMHLSKKHNFSLHTASCIMAGISLCSEFSKIMSEMVYVNGVDASQGMVLDAPALPFHLCSLFIFLFFYLPFSSDSPLRRRLLNFFTPIGCIGAGAAILMATNGTDFLDIRSYQCFVYHAGMMWFAIYLIQTHQVSLGLHEWFLNLVTLLALVFVMIWVNSILQVYQTNFLYVVRPPVENLPILNLNHGWYVYLFTMILLGFIGLTAFHLPFILKERKAR